MNLIYYDIFKVIIENQYSQYMYTCKKNVFNQHCCSSFQNVCFYSNYKPLPPPLTYTYVSPELLMKLYKWLISGSLQYFVPAQQTLSTHMSNLIYVFILHIFFLLAFLIKYVFSGFITVVLARH